MRISDWSSDVCSSDLGAVAGFLDHWRPDIGLIVESEFWPNLLRGAAARGTRLVLLNGRISAESCRGWERAKPLIASLLDCFGLVMARSPEDRERLVRLGAGAVLSPGRSEEHTSELQSLMRISYAVFCLKKKKIQNKQ